MDGSIETPRAMPLYEANAKAIERETAALYKKFTDPTRWNERVARMFKLDEAQVALLDPQDIQDIKNFARYAFEALVTSALHAPRLKQHVGHSGRADIERIVKRGIETSFIEHDLIHAAVAYARSGGASLRPAYHKLTEAQDKGEAPRDPAIAREELIVHLFWRGNEDWVFERVLQGADPIEAYKQVHFSFIPLQKEEQLKKLMRTHSMNPLELIARIQEADLREELQLWYDPRSAETRDDPVYNEILKNLYANARSEHPDPLIRFKEFKRIIEPLLIELRAKPIL